MELLDVARIILRWVHAIAAVTWVGGIIFYIVALEPSLQSIDMSLSKGELEKSLGRAFRELVEISIMVLSVTGVLLTVDRLSQGGVTATYVVILGVKVVASAAMFFMAREMNRRGAPIVSLRENSPTGAVRQGEVRLPMGIRSRIWAPSRLLLYLGLLIFLLAIALRATFESNLKAGLG
ncbi:MAG: urate hydroxylase PuuD [Chloroflexi bacterium]|nr:urate hydroxylase PuuD [Chloroflexota bacterium]